ncbi:MAG: polysaccharide pyruvyl transferase family protein, partial [Thermofilum sp.]|nr:polysaccharide pyruvyl transferase family protein [Thermofilum sp.]
MQTLRGEVFDKESRGSHGRCLQRGLIVTKQAIYGLLVSRTKNLGDDVQSLAAAQFLPKVDLFIDRDNPRLPPHLRNELGDRTRIKVIMNGWYTLKPLSWMPDPIIKPLLISFHVHPPLANMFLRRQSVIDYLKFNGPVGTRDFYTYKMLSKRNIAAFFSGCLTLTLDYKYKFDNIHEYILVTDLNEKIVNIIKTVFKEKNIIILSQNLFVSISESLVPSKVKKIIKKALGEANYSLLNIISYNLFDIHKKHIANFIERLYLAEKFISLIGQSQLVITSRLHTALPALSFGKPVIFINDYINDPRFSGYMNFLYPFTSKGFAYFIKKV